MQNLFAFLLNASKINKEIRVGQVQAINLPKPIIFFFF